MRDCESDFMLAERGTYNSGQVGQPRTTFVLRDTSGSKAFNARMYLRLDKISLYPLFTQSLTTYDRRPRPYDRDAGFWFHQGARRRIRIDQSLDIVEIHWSMAVYGLVARPSSDQRDQLPISAKQECLAQ